MGILTDIMLLLIQHLSYFSIFLFLISYHIISLIIFITSLFSIFSFFGVDPRRVSTEHFPSQIVIGKVSTVVHNSNFKSWYEYLTITCNCVSSESSPCVNQ